MSDLKKQVRTIYDERETLLQQLIDNADAKTNRELMEKEIDRIVDMDFATNQFRFDPNTLEVQKASYRVALITKLDELETVKKNEESQNKNGTDNIFKVFTGKVRENLKVFAGFAFVVVFIVLVSAGFASLESRPNSSSTTPVVETSFQVSDGAINITEDGSNYRIIEVKIPNDATKIVIYEGTNDLESGFDTNVVRTRVFHEKGTYVYFAEVYFGDEKFTLDSVMVNYPDQNAE